MLYRVVSLSVQMKKNNQVIDDHESQDNGYLVGEKGQWLEGNGGSNMVYWLCSFSYSSCDLVIVHWAEYVVLCTFVCICYIYL